MNWGRREPVNPDDYDEWKIYVVKCGPYFKVGIAQHPDRRLRAMQVGSPFKIKRILTRTIKKYLATGVEAHIHGLLAEFSHRGEWFLVDEPTLRRAVAAGLRARSVLSKSFWATVDETEERRERVQERWRNKTQMDAIQTPSVENVQ